MTVRSVTSASTLQGSQSKTNNHMGVTSTGISQTASLGTSTHIIIIKIIIINMGSHSQAGRAKKPFRGCHNGYYHVTGTPCISAWFYFLG